MKLMSILIIIFIIKTLLAGESSKKIQLENNMNKHYLIDVSFRSADSLFSEDREQKSVFKAALYSAVIPGTGQYYAGSVWKTILFAGIEVAGWTTYFIYTSKGENQETDMEKYADAHWSAKKYWSRLYYDAKQQGVPDLPVYEVDENNILVEYDADMANSLRFLEEALGHTHKLPTTKTQQYYEMIYKYLTQFGNGWEDANFFERYYGNTNKLTPQMFAYRDMRNNMNNYFDVATTATNLILINHVLSALDAAWTTRNFNRQLQLKVRAYNKRYFDENVRMYGINVSW